jgi:hypothetical protein
MARELTLNWKKLKEPGRIRLDTTDDNEAIASPKKDRLERHHVSKSPPTHNPSMLA